MSEYQTLLEELEFFRPDADEAVQAIRDRGADAIRELVGRVGELEKQRENMPSELLEAFRGVETPCPSCGGWGVRAYGTTATWRGGVGGATITAGVCDKCWGSGDADRRWPSHREAASLASRNAELEAEVGRLRGRLLNIVQCYEIRSELYTSDEQCAENLHDKARQALEQSR